MPNVKIIRYNCICDQGCCQYQQFDLLVDGVIIDPGWCDSISEAMGYAAEVPGVVLKAVVVENGGDLPEERY